MKTIKQFFLVAAVLLFATSCIDDITVKGNGIQASEGRIVSNFERVKSSGEFEVHITEGEEHEVIVSADENLLQYIETYVSGETLQIDVQGIRNLKNRVPMEIFITTPYIEGIKLSGSGIITTDYFVCEEMDIALSGSGKIITAFDAEDVDARISGSGEAKLSGFANDASFAISGSGRIDAAELDLIDCSTTTSGSGDMWISVSRYLDSRISGSGNVYYYGTPSVETHISGSGNVVNQN